MVQKTKYLTPVILFKQNVDLVFVKKVFLIEVQLKILSCDSKIIHKMSAKKH